MNKKTTNSKAGAVQKTAVADTKNAEEGSAAAEVSAEQSMAQPENDSETKSEAGAAQDIVEPQNSKSKANPDQQSLRKRLEPYFKSHPKVDVFYVSSDNTPFFEKQWAREHQQSIDPRQEVKTIKR